MPRKPEQLAWVRYPVGGDSLRLGLLSRHAELAHRRLAEYHWQTGCWVRARSRFASVLARCPQPSWPAVLAELAQANWRCRAGQLVNPDVAAIRAEALAFIRHFSAMGQKSAQRRWGNKQPAPQAEARSNGPCPSNAQATTKPITTLCPSHAHVTTKAVTTLCPGCNQTVHDQNSESTSLAFNAERLTLSGSALKGSASREKDFLASVKATMSLWNTATGKTELVNWGGWWRKRFREDPDKAQRVLNEVLCLVREHRITNSPGAAATDLWKRLP